MTSDSPKFSIGIEEEYLLVDPETRSLASLQPPEFMARCKERLPGRVTHEFLQSQVEIGTGVCNSIADASNRNSRAPPNGCRDRTRIRHADDRLLDPPLGALARAGPGRHGPLPHPRRRAPEPRPPHGDLRHARPRRHRGPRPARRPDEPGQLLHAPHAGPLLLLPLLGRPRHRPQGLPPHHHRRPPPLRPPRSLRKLERLARTPPSPRRNRNGHRPLENLVGPPPLRQAPHTWRSASATSAPGPRTA